MNPYRVLFSNDTTNILTCKSPYNERGCMGIDPETGKQVFHSCSFDASKLEATVDETAGVGIDVHMLQPGLGWVPWWKSTHYPFAEQIRFMRERTGMEPSADPYSAYMAAGGDMVEAFTRRCREHGLAPFVSFRLNDSHGHEFVECDPKDLPSWAWFCFSPVHVNHPEWRLGADLNDWNNRVLNWAIPEVVAHKLAFIEEIIEQYDLDGFELDFMRHCKFFRDDGPAPAERLRIMLAFVGKVRAALDRREAANGRHRHLCVRIPAFEAVHAELGIDVAEFAKAGVEMFNLSYYYFTGQQGDFAALRAQAPEAAFYVEMCHCTSVQNIPDVPAGYDNFRFRRTTPNQYYTTAHLAYARGLQGVSTFNFVYYREHGIGDRGPFDEPPFEIHQGCADPAFVARQSQHYFIAHTWMQPEHGRFPLNDTWNIRQFRPGEPVAFQLDMAPPTGGWQEDGRLRVQSPEDLGGSRWRAVMNGVELLETSDRSEPYANPYSPLLGTPEQHRAWIVPAHICKDGLNTIEITLLDGGKPVPVVFLDVAMPTFQGTGTSEPQRLLNSIHITPQLIVDPMPTYAQKYLPFAMAASIEVTPGGRLWTCWAGGEDGPNAYLLASYSDDQGASWREPVFVIDPQAHGLKMGTRLGSFWCDPRGRLWLFFHQSVGMFDGSCSNWFVRCDKPDAETPVWTEPVYIGFGASLNKPIVRQNGEWILPVSLWERWHIDKPFADCYHELDAVRGANVFVSDDEGGHWRYRGGIIFEDSYFNEHSVVELRDGRLWMLSRGMTAALQSFSGDGGQTWAPQSIAFPHVNSKCVIRRLHSGAILLVRHGQDMTQSTSDRQELTAFLSPDDGTTWSPGLLLDERDGVSYPDIAQAPDGEIYIHYDRNRATDAEILFARFREEDIKAGKLVSPGAARKNLVKSKRGMEHRAKKEQHP